ncbi:hypothetical protein [Bacillus thuringiensis]|uniref:hypothetical protein n=1 Tax=Bacillus cereus group TaxID=86661 RepID=UPI00330F0F54|nr:hypothetical protein [Bacillus cereus]MCU5270876.1 hypothetical protein [Bacillus cereus]MCU5348437.1 hypothetical protein [Bacillus cereus]MCU5606896.1 hypothetical protein [Bacillus cereus]MCU5759043.1 hypothetical protein [Bacillus cereus]
MKKYKLLSKFLFILLLSLVLTSCKSEGSIGNNAPEPTIKIKNIAENANPDANTFVFSGSDNSSFFKEVFWSKSEKNNFYKGQIKTNDINIDETFNKEKIIESPLPKKYELTASLNVSAVKPNMILGKLKDDLGQEYTWEQPFKRESVDHNYVIDLPSFKGKTAKIAIRFVWLNNKECYGVADQLFILKKQ